MCRILVVEDEEGLCRAMVAYLESRGARPIVTDTAREAVSTLDRGEVDLVVLDLKLVGGDGLDVLRHIRESPGLAHLPILAISAWEMEPAWYDYLEPGDYLTKPFDMRTLGVMIRQLLGLALDQHLSAYKAALPEATSPGVCGRHE